MKFSSNLKLKILFVMVIILYWFIVKACHLKQQNDFKMKCKVLFLSNSFYKLHFSAYCMGACTYIIFKTRSWNLNLFMKIGGYNGILIHYKIPMAIHSFFYSFMPVLCLSFFSLKWQSILKLNPSDEKWISDYYYQVVFFHCFWNISLNCHCIYFLKYLQWIRMSLLISWDVRSFCAEIFLFIVFVWDFLWKLLRVCCVVNAD